MPGPAKTSSDGTRYEQVTAQLREQIRAGVLKPGERLPSYNKVRDLYGVHTNTMEKVHAQLEREGLIVRRRGSGTYVAEQNATPQKARTGVIGLCGSGFKFRNYQAYWSKLYQGIHHAADDFDVQVLTLNHQSTSGWEKADGILLASWSPHDILQQLPPCMPRVSVVVPIEGVPSVVADEQAGVRTATEYLIARGHRRIAFLHSKVETLSPFRLTAYRGALGKAGIKADQRRERQMISPYIEAQEFIESGRRTMQAWLDDGWSTLGCTALLVQNDETAIGAIEALQQAGLRVPEDISVIGFDGTEICDFFKPRLTSVEIPLSQIAYRGVELLLKQIETNEMSDGHELLPVRVAERDTVIEIK